MFHLSSSCSYNRIDVDKNIEVKLYIMYMYVRVLTYIIPYTHSAVSNEVIILHPELLGDSIVEREDFSC